MAYTIKESESLSHQGRQRSGGRAWDHQSISSSAWTSSRPSSHVEDRIPHCSSLPSEAWPQQSSNHNSPGQNYLLSVSNWEEGVTKVTNRRGKNVLRVFCICQCAGGMGVTHGIEMGQAVGREGCCCREKRMWGMKGRQTTQNFPLLNFNLLDKNNSKWGTEYAWSREGILSFSGDSSLNGIANYVSHCSVQFS